MKNLKSAGKRWYSKVGIHLTVILVLVLLAIYVIDKNTMDINIEKSKYNEYVSEQDSIVTYYKKQLDSIQNANYLLEKELASVNSKLDSIYGEEQHLKKDYDEEVNALDSASISDNAKWFYSKLDSIRHYYGYPKR